MSEVKNAIYRWYKKAVLQKNAEGIILGNLFGAVKSELPLMTEEDFGKAVVEMCDEDPLVKWVPDNRHPLQIDPTAFLFDLKLRKDARLFQNMW